MPKTDADYRDWLDGNQNGYVLNVHASLDPNHIVAHKASCAMISSEKVMPGAYTERGYRKVCSNDLAELQIFARSHGRTDGSFSKRCTKCNPL